MKKPFNRRSFIKKSVVLSAASVISLRLAPKFLYGKKIPTKINIAVVKGKNYFNNTLIAVELLGGMKKFVPQNSKVGILINADFDKPGAYVNPDVSIAVLKMCFDAGAREVQSLQNIKPEYWERSQLADKYRKEINSLKIIEKNQFPSKFNENDFKLIEVTEGKSLKEGEVVKELFNCDVFINIPISKHHSSTFLTCALKNMMGITTRKTGITFHTGSDIRNDPEYLGQCIADLNSIRKPDLIIADSIKFIVTNGPDGPGELVKLDKVIAGTDIVGVDSLCASYLDYEPGEIVVIKKAYELGLGEMDVDKLNIKEISI